LANVNVGDEVITEIDGIGSLKNTIIGEPEEHTHVG
jgi:2-keto-4-pentenoate hydratase/2-oxohepta-3-ene-1,7-dioic acid hydratase in catechol pathway